jgi:hypothetical protein
MNDRNFVERKERKKFGLPIILSLDNNTIDLPARLYDIGEGGASFKSNVLFPVGEVVEIIIPYPRGVLISTERMEPVRLRAEVRWSNDFSDDQDFLVRYIHGCKFVNGDDPKVTNEVNGLMELSEQLGPAPMRF